MCSILIFLRPMPPWLASEALCCGGRTYVSNFDTSTPSRRDIMRRGVVRQADWALSMRRVTRPRAYLRGHTKGSSNSNFSSSALKKRSPHSSLGVFGGSPILPRNDSSEGSHRRGPRFGVSPRTLNAAFSPRILKRRQTRSEVAKSRVGIHAAAPAMHDGTSWSCYCRVHCLAREREDRAPPSSPPAACCSPL